MFTLRGFRGVRKLENLYYFKHVNTVRLTSTETAVVNKDETLTRKNVKPVSTKELDILKDTFIRGLFTGAVDRKIFEYPEVLRISETDVVLEHCSKIENFFKNESPNDTLSRDTIERLRDLELFGLTVPQKYGGAGYSETERTFIQECTGNYQTVGRFLGHHENLGCKIINLFGSEEQKAKYLPRLAQGKSLMSVAYLESGPLVDLSNIEGVAINDETKNSFILLTEKKWVHHADKADLFLVGVKSSVFNDSDAEVVVKLSFFIVERNAPGVTVHRLKSEYAQENDLYDISFDHVVVPQENLLGNIEANGFEILKYALSHCNVTDAALCCNLLKHATHEVIQFIQEKNVAGGLDSNHSLVKENLASLVAYIYALESVIYLITGRFDMYDKPDLFHESIFAKALAIEFLQIATKKYVEIIGRESFKSSGILEKAIKAIQYYSVFDENIQYLKLMSGAEGIVHAAGKLSERVKILRNPFDNNWESFKWLMTTQKKAIKNIKKEENFKLELQRILQNPADILDESYARFRVALEEIFISHGAEIMKNEHIVIKFGEMAAYLYAFIACLSRASSSVCYNFNDNLNECRLAEAFGFIAESKIKELYSEEIQHKNMIAFYKDLGEETFNRKEYPVEHPLSRTF